MSNLSDTSVIANGNYPTGVTDSMIGGYSPRQSAKGLDQLMDDIDAIPFSKTHTAGGVMYVVKAKKVFNATRGGAKLKSVTYEAYSTDEHGKTEGFPGLFNGPEDAIDAAIVTLDEEAGAVSEGDRFDGMS